MHSLSTLDHSLMKRVLCCALTLACAATAFAKHEKAPPSFGPLHVLEVGLNGEYIDGQPTSVRLQIANPQAQPLTLELRLQAQYHDPQWTPAPGDSFSKRIVLQAGEQREIELPVRLPVANADLWVEARAVAPDGQVVAYDVVKGDKLSARTTEGNVGMLCATDETCKEAQQQAQFSGTMEERVDKNKTLHFVILRQPRAHWWPYAFLQTLLLAQPMGSYTAEQRAAVEDFLRRGGRVVLLEKETADAGFLSAYRQGPPRAEAVRVSRGKLYRVAGLQSQTLGGIFTGGALAELMAASPWQAAWMPDRGNPVMSWFRHHAATQFRFPRLRWLLVWLMAYVLVIGLVNFAALRRLRRLEWGWLTILVGSLVFAAGLYLSSSWQRPKQFTLDNLAVYWMDQRSPHAYGDYGLRISAPQRAALTVNVKDTSFWVRPDSAINSEIHIGAEIRQPHVAPGVELRLGPPQQLEVSLLRWSFSDQVLEGPRQFSGSLREVAPGRLRNETGVALHDALLVDYEAQKIWTLGAMAPGAEASLAGSSPISLYQVDRQGKRVEPTPVDSDTGPLSLVQLARMFPFGKGVAKVAIGLSDGPTLPAELAGARHERHDRALLVVFQ